MTLWDRKKTLKLYAGYLATFPDEIHKIFRKNSYSLYESVGIWLERPAQILEQRILRKSVIDDYGLEISYINNAFKWLSENIRLVEVFPNTANRQFSIHLEISFPRPIVDIITYYVPEITCNRCIEIVASIPYVPSDNINEKPICATCNMSTYWHNFILGNLNTWPNKEYVSGKGRREIITTCPFNTNCCYRQFYYKINSRLTHLQLLQ